jgi:hypothetical protein
VSKGGVFLRTSFSKEELEEKAKSLILEKGEEDADYECAVKKQEKKLTGLRL